MDQILIEQESLIKEADPELFEAIQNEDRRQREDLELIASENYVSRAIRAVLASSMTNKYAEGYPGKRYYGGCEYVDVAETLALTRLKAIFGADHANVQVHAGAQANMAVFMSVLKPGETVLGMALAHGGHLTHGTKVSFSGKIYHAVAYGVHPETELIDFDEVRALAREHRPKLIIAGASAYPRIMEYAPFREIADEVGAVLMVDMAHIAGLVATNLHPSPVPYAEFVTSTTHKTLRGPRGGLVLCRAQYAATLDKTVFPGIQGGPFMNSIAAKALAFHEAQQPSFAVYQRNVVNNAKVLGEELVRGGLRLVARGTETHLLLIDLSAKNVSGKVAEQYLAEINITVNKNAIPFDQRPPMEASGIRVGTPAVTSRGFGADDCREVGKIIAEGLDDIGSHAKVPSLKARVAELTAQHAVP
jgi:glycine hydroxymethyltransferase